jgi:hypothetical protein
MFDAASRYYAIPEAVYVAPDGSRIAYKTRRLPPRSGTLAVQSIVTVNAGDRLDLIAARAMGDPRLFWRIADANDALNPFDLPVGRRALNVPAIAFR